MPEKETLERAERDKRAGKSASTQAGEFVREEMEHIREVLFSVCRHIAVLTQRRRRERVYP